MAGKEKIPNDIEENIKESAQSPFGFETIVLHELGYKLWEQARLTKLQRRFLLWAKIHYENKINPSGKESKGSNKKQQIKEVKDQLGRRYSHGS